ncbi:MAG: hypothetical protein RIT43_1595 [Bacteroidota bacterium]|jgi:glycosyltransferase involved in cell wall biosynthesis
MNILYVIPTLGAGGAEVMLCQIIENLHRRGNNIMLILIHPLHETFENIPNHQFILENIDIQYVELKTKISWIGIKVNNDEFKDLVNKFNPEIIHSHLFEAEVLSRSYFHNKTNYFSHFHDNMFQLRKIKLRSLISFKSIIHYIERLWLLKKYQNDRTLFLGISSDTIDFMKNNFPKSFSQKIIYFPNAINFKQIQCQSIYLKGDKKSNFHKKLSLISIGNLVEKKNHFLLIKIASELLKRGVEFEVNILGFGPLKKELEELKNKLNLDKQVFFRGSVGNVVEYLSKSNLYIHTAKYEPFGLVLLEAMAAGLPVITFDGKGNRDLIQQGDNGYMIYEENPELFVDRILHLWNNTQEYARISKNAIEFSKQYDIENYTNKLLELYQSALNEKTNS